MNEENSYQKLHYFRLFTDFGRILTEKIPFSLLTYLKKYSVQTWGDLYKFIYQGSCGWVHLKKISGLEGVKIYLEQELDVCTKKREDEELFELLNEKTMFGRLNLRVWKEEIGLSSSHLWKLMEESLKNTPANLSIFFSSWNLICKLYDEGILTTKKNEKRALKKALSDLSFQFKKYEECLDLPLISHSPLFRMNYDPSYRIVSRIVLENFLKNMINYSF
ncbi:MAG: hypothetical protein K9W46_03640 [Candidatus Heimdallarchaeum endolithica]|uniref:Uncharacterized protein n=1 Tax=Candidatus Heimdallarchaeum endolithica TaxID=2876572 RepID=A0A9Y1BS59_9ARCH|nr:MAG: hypothetical protein K9W46_03640 [Candidatus Heimdallarchaeum endolithica]